MRDALPRQAGTGQETRAPSRHNEAVELIRPMLATTGPLPTGSGWAFEFKWDGVRTITYVEDGRVTLLSRSGRTVTSHYPELTSLVDAFGVDRVVLDGEVVAFAADGRPDFGELQARMHVQHPRPELLRAVPVTYLVFDLLVWDGQSLLEIPYADRRALLEQLELEATMHVDVPPSYSDEPGDTLLETARSAALEGVVAKRLTSLYEPGHRSAAWVKVPLLSTQEVVIGGWKPGEGRRAGNIGSLLLGIPGADGLDFVGHVGTGFTQSALTAMRAQLDPLERPASPFVSVPREYARHARWVDPVLVGEVEFRNWTRDRRLRAPSWRGLRADKSPDDVRPIG
jgi:bifunctional non-homologous end joining protein LigD